MHAQHNIYTRIRIYCIGLLQIYIIFFIPREKSRGPRSFGFVAAVSALSSMSYIYTYVILTTVTSAQSVDLQIGINARAHIHTANAYIYNIIYFMSYGPNPPLRHRSAILSRCTRSCRLCLPLVSSSSAVCIIILYTYDDDDNDDIIIICTPAEPRYTRVRLVLCVHIHILQLHSSVQWNNTYNNKRDARITILVYYIYR